MNNDKIYLAEQGQLIATDRYFLKDKEGNLLEDNYTDMCIRVSEFVSSAETNAELKELWRKQFFMELHDQRLIAAGRIWTNAGTENPQLPNCFVFGIRDSKESIWGTLYKAAATLSAGGGTGFNFGELRSRGMATTRSKGVASGPASFIKMYDASGDTIVQGGSRRAAMKGDLPCWHPDILEFVFLKDESLKLSRFNISGDVNDYFMESITDENRFHLPLLCFEPYLKKRCNIYIPGLEEYKSLTERVTFMNNHYMERKILFVDEEGLKDKNLKGSIIRNSDLWWAWCTNAWRCGDPGIMFLDTINKQNPFMSKEELADPFEAFFNKLYIKASNPCAEEIMPEDENCMLAWLNLVKIFTGGKFRFSKEEVTVTKDWKDNWEMEVDWCVLKDTVQTAIRFLDNSIDVSTYPTPENETMAKNTRRIGLGIAGLADLFLLMGIRYGSEKAIIVTDTIGERIKEYATEATMMLGQEKGNFPWFELCKSKGHYKGEEYRRNAIMLAIAPVGTSAWLAGYKVPGEGVSSSLEPNFSFLSMRKDGITPEGRIIFHPLVKLYIEDNKLAVPSTNVSTWLKQILPDFFVTANELTPDEHIAIHAAFQKHIDASISKTTNLPNSATIEDVSNAYINAWKMGLKSFTIYRDGSKGSQVLNHVSEEKQKPDDNLTKEDPKAIVTRPWAFKRPDILFGQTSKIKTAQGHLFLVVNSDMSGPCEVFLITGKQGSEVSTYTESIGRLISKGLQRCSSLEDRRTFLIEMINQMKDIRGEAVVWDKDRSIKSIPDAVAILLKEFIDRTDFAENLPTEEQVKEDIMDFVNKQEGKYYIENIMDEKEFLEKQTCPNGSCS